MKKIKDYLIRKKALCIIGIFTIVTVVASMGYFYYQNEQKQKILDSMKITFNDVQNIEYGTKDYDVQKELVKEVKYSTLKEVPKVDTFKVGEHTLKFILIQDNLEKEIEYKINIKDTKAPEIKFKDDSIELTVGDEFEYNANIESVKDIVDGDIAFNEKTLEINKKATEEYNKLDAKQIRNDTKVANTLLSEFLIEDIQDKDEKNLYLKNCYYINSDVDTSKQGEYTVHVIAIDKNGLKTSNKYEVIVKAKERQSQNTNNNSSNRDNDLSNYKNSPSDHSSISNKGSIYSVISTAQAQIGKPYVAGGRGPDTFDCEGLVRYAYAQNGYNIGIARSAGYSIGTDWTKAKPGDIIVQKNHVAIVVSLDSSQVSSGNGYYLTIVEAKNPTMGIKQTMMNLGPEQTIGILDIRRII